MPVILKDWWVLCKKGCVDVTFFVVMHCLFVHFFCLPKRNEPKKKAASNLFWAQHFLSCPRITTRGPCPAGWFFYVIGPLKQYCLLKPPQQVSKQSLYPKIIWGRFKPSFRARFANQNIFNQITIRRSMPSDLTIGLYKQEMPLISNFRNVLTWSKYKIDFGLTML